MPRHLTGRNSRAIGTSTGACVWDLSARVSHPSGSPRYRHDLTQLVPRLAARKVCERHARTTVFSRLLGVHLSRSKRTRIHHHGLSPQLQNPSTLLQPRISSMRIHETSWVSMRLRPRMPVCASRHLSGKNARPFYLTLPYPKYNCEPQSKTCILPPEELRRVPVWQYTLVTVTISLSASPNPILTRCSLTFPAFIRAPPPSNDYSVGHPGIHP